MTKVFGVVFLLLWFLPGIFSLSGLDQRELFEACGLFSVLVLSWIFRRTFLSAPVLDRIFSAILFVLTALLFSPPFHRSVATGTLGGPSTRWGVWIPCLSILLFCLWARMSFPPIVSGIKRSSQTPAERLEVWLSRFSVRLNLMVALAILSGVSLALATLPMKTVLLRVAVLGSFALGLRPLLSFARLPGGVNILRTLSALALLIVLVCGGLRYKQLMDCVTAGAAELTQGDTAAATRFHEQARQLNQTFYAKSQELAIERHWAQYFEKNNFPGEALERWQRLATLQGVEPQQFSSVLRMQCRLGDSLSVWRRAVYEGFSGVGSAEILPGIEGLADGSGDLRAKLLAALLAWEHNAPETERRKRLEDVQHIAPHEPTSYNLLKRMGVTLPAAHLWLPESLIVGRKASPYSVAGSIGELGVVETLVVLDQGQWEIGLKGRAVPLNGIWPIIRVELNGHEIGRTQVTRTEEHEVLPFVCVVNRGNLYHVKIVFENMESDVQAGHKSMRGLSISGISFRRNDN